MKHDELRKTWEERFDTVKTPMSRKNFYKEIEKAVKGLDGELTAADLAVISEIHKQAKENSKLDEKVNKDEVFKAVHRLDVVREFLNSTGKEDVARDLENGKYENYPYKTSQSKAKERVSEGIQKEEKAESRNERKSAKEYVMESRKEIADKILQSMKKGELMWRKDWQKLAPYNGKTGRNYHGVNQIRLFVESVTRGLDDPRFMTFKQAEEKGYSIKKGAQGIMLENWQFTKEQPLMDAAGNILCSEDGKPLTETVELDKPIVTYFRVFNAKDIEGIEPLPKLDVEKEPLKNEFINNVLGSSRCEVTEKVQDGAYYSVEKDKIVIPPRENFTSLDAFLATALHEMAHSTGHESCLNRPLTGKFGSEDYAKEELRAELGSAFSQISLGVSLADIDIDNHGAYIQNWISVLENNYNEFFIAVSDADKIAGVIEKNYEKYCIEHGLDKEQTKSLGYVLDKDGIRVTIDDGIATFKNTTDKSFEVSINGIGMIMEAGEEENFSIRSMEVRPLIDAIRENSDALSVVEVIKESERNRQRNKENDLALAK